MERVRVARREAKSMGLRFLEKRLILLVDQERFSSSWILAPRPSDPIEDEQEHDEVVASPVAKILVNDNDLEKDKSSDAEYLSGTESKSTYSYQ